MILEDNQINNYEKAILDECPIHAKIGRVLVIQIRHEYEDGGDVKETGMPVIKKGELWLPKNAVAATEGKGGLDNANEVVLAVVKSVGPSHDGNPSYLKTNDLVYVFPSVFETMIKINEVDYMSYSHRDIVAGVNDSEQPLVRKKEQE